MKKGWHVDTRLTLQMARISPIRPQMLNESDLVIFHQNHLRISTAYHGTPETNSLSEVKEPYINSDSWGLAENVLEEINLHTQGVDHSHFFSPSQGNHIQGALETSDIGDISKRLDYNLARTRVFLADEISILTKGSLVHCYTANEGTKLALSQICKRFEVEIVFQELKSVKTKNSGSKNSNVTLLILDYGVDSLQPILSNFYGGGKNQTAIRAGWIALNTGQIASSYLNPNMRVAVIRAQNWATRELARKYFSLPLFNNYTSVLSGQIIAKPKISSAEEIILGGGVVRDYGLDPESTQDWSVSPALRIRLMLFNFLFSVSNLLPASIKNLLKGPIKKALGF